VGVILWRNDGRETLVKENDGGRWSSDDVVLWLGRRQNRDMIKWWKSGQGWDDIFIVLECVSWVVQGGWPTVVVRIQRFDFDLIEEVMGRSVAERWSGDNELVSSWDGSTTWHSDVVTSARGEAAPRRSKGGDNGRWDDTNLTRPKNKENTRGRFSCYKWTVKI
jgi:hypothetical protein